ncbi:MAG: RagB/SusD family nutrient uptake outer membrane protein [Filimonas sp.]|nr:RagB/SusD family nutrient uptake outer membrane protein [Filimonas sp.]
MKRNYNLLIIAACLTIILSACSKFFDKPPQGQITQEEAFKDEAGLVSFTNGIYTYLGDGDFMGGRVQVLSDILADELKGDKFTGDYAEIYGRRNSIFGATRDAMYLKGYKIINAANLVLENLSIANTQKDNLRGQALFFRGMTHFELVRLFAQPWGYSPDNSQYGIPLRLKSGQELLQRATVKQVYDQVIADLKAADSLLAPDANSGKFYTASKWIAEAYLAKVYFQMNDFANAYKYADQVIKSGKFQLDADYTSRYSVGLTKEAILRIANEVNHFQPGTELIGNWRSDKAVPTCNFTDAYYNNAVSRVNDKRKIWYSNTLQAGYNVLTKYNMDYTTWSCLLPILQK